jgi:hypothetical protein
VSEWNLSVRLTGQGSGLARTLRDLSRDAEAASRDVNALKRDIQLLRREANNSIRIRLDVDAGHLRSDVSAALSSAGAGQGLGVRLDIDAAHLRADVSAALAGAQAGQDLRVRLDVDAAHLRSDVSAALAGAGAGQNLSVRLDVDAAHLRADVATALATARAGQALSVRLDVDAAHLRADVAAALATARAGQNLRVRLDMDAAHLRADVSAALTAAGSGQGLTVNLRLGNAMQLRREVEDAVRWAAWGHRIEIPIGLADPMQLRRDVSDAVRWASMHQTITVRVTPDTSALRTPLPGLPGGGGSGGGGAGFGLAGLLPIVTAAIPLFAGLTQTAAPLAGTLIASGGAATAFGIALAGQIGPLGEVADAEKKYQDAVRDHGARSKEAVEAQVAYQKQLNALPPETQKAAVALSSLKTTFTDWSDEMSGFTMQPVTKSFTLLEQIIPRLSPEVESFSGQMDRLLNVAGGAVASPAFAAMADDVARLTDAKLDDFTDQVIHLLRIVSQGDADDGVIGQIMDYMRENGPAAREALDAIGDAVGNLLEAASATGPIMLTLVTAVANLVAALPPQAVTVILQAAAALKLLQLAGAGAAAVAGRIGAVRAAILGLAAASTAAGGGLAGLRAAFLALGTAAKASVIIAGIGLAAVAISELMDVGREAPPDIDKLTTSLGKLGQTGKVGGELGRLGKDMGDLYEKVRNITDPSTLDNIQNGLVKVFSLGMADSTPSKEARQWLDAIDEGLTNLVKDGKADLAAAAYKRLQAAYAAGGKDVSEFTGQMDNYKSALADAKFEQELAAASMGLFGQAAQGTSAKLDAQKASADGLRQSIVALNDVNRAAGSAMSAFEQSIDDVTEATKEHAGALRMRDGDLDLGSEKAREAEKVLSGLAANTDAAATAARDQGRSWEYVNGIYDRGQDAFIKAAQAMGLTKTQAEALSKSYLAIPESKTTRVNMEAEDAQADLEAFNAKVAASPGTKSVTLKTLSSAAERILEAFGYKVTHLKDGSVTVTAMTGAALTGVQNVAGAVAALRDKTITITTNQVVNKWTATQPGSKVPVAKRDWADGGVVDYYAAGGIQRGGVRHFAGGSENHVAQIAPAGSWRVWGEPETMGEGYVPFAPSKRPRSRAITEEIVRRLGGDPAGIQWNANGSITDWRYDPTTGSLYSASDAGRAGHKTRKVKGKEVDYFDLGAVEKKLKSISKLTVGWNNDLATVADRVGGDVAEALAGMGEDGMALARKMAHGSTKYINDMASALRNLQKTAKASLTDYTRQMSNATKVNKDFSDDLVRLAGMGYGDLAAQLAQQGDTAAQQLADAATRDRGKAAKANAAAKAASQALTSDQVQDLVQIIAAVRTKTTGLHDVAAATGLGEDEILAVASKARGQISSALGSRAERFLADLTKAGKGLAYADGGIRAGLYATQGGIVRFAEPSTHGEAYIPLGANKRRTALPVLADVASRFGVGLTDGQSGRVVIIREQGPLIGQSHFHIGDRKSDRDLARAIEYRQSYQLRRLARGGVGARG